MNAISYLVLAAALGVDYGWQQSADGQWEYIVQVEPSLLNSLADGERIVSELPSELQGVRRIVLRVGTQEVPRERIPVAIQASGLQTVRRPGDRWSTDASPPLANEELPDRPRLDLVPFMEPRRVGGSRWSNELNPPANHNAGSNVLSVPNRNFNALPKKPASEIASFPRAEKGVDPYRPLTKQGSRSLPGPDAEDAEVPLDPNLHRPPYGEDTRFAESRRGAGGSNLPERNSKPTASISATAKGDTAANAAPLSRSGFPTILALFLFASIGGNLYLGWLARDFYWRYRDLAWEMRSGNSTSE